MKRPLVVGLGRVELQFIGVIPSFPDRDGDVEVDSVSIQVGGSGAVAIGAVTELGCRGRFACKLAEEFAGNFILEALREAGIETRGVLASDRELSGLRFTTLDREHKRRLSVFSRGDVGGIDESEIDVNRLLDDASAVLIDGGMPRTQVRLAEAAKHRRVPVIYDGNEFGDQVGELVALADILIASERLAAELARTDDLERSLLELQQLGPQAVIITLGESGSIGLHGEKLVRQPVHPVAVVDNRGAGAVYHGAFTAALLSELPFERCMEFASVAAGLSCMQVGEWAGIPSRAQVIAAMRG